ncbi:uncharacterized protein LOC143363893 [Halictus rubicundus]|uniref:uncharacterized protein LOC143363893 n=1 Tax=Halictus rubicundus TaxID=77578 RepID=UPI004036AD72
MYGSLIHSPNKRELARTEFRLLKFARNKARHNIEPKTRELDYILYGTDVNTIRNKDIPVSLVEHEDGTSASPLTNLEIQETIQNVQQAILGVNASVPDYSSVKTPATGIIVCTPSAPVVPKSSLDSANISLGRYRSLDTLMTDDKDATLKIENLGSESQEDMDVDEAVQIELIVEGKKHISRSIPAIHVNKIARSDTFVREQEKAKANVEQAESSTTIIENEPVSS